MADSANLQHALTCTVSSACMSMGSACDFIMYDVFSSIFRGGMWPWPRPSERPKNFLVRYTVKNGISNLYILLKSAIKMQEMPFQRPEFQKISGGHAPGPPLQLCRHYIWPPPLTKILAKPLYVFISYSTGKQCS